MNSNASSTPPTSFKRRNSIASPTVLPPKLDHILTKQQRISSSFPIPNGTKIANSLFPNVDDFQLISLSSLSYTSLRDLLPSSQAVQSPTASSPQFNCEIPIKNHLVKQAAWAYLQPMSSSLCSSGRHSFRHMWVRFSDEYFRSPVNACLGFIIRRVIPTITRAFDWLLGAIRVRTTSHIKEL